MREDLKNPLHPKLRLSELFIFTDKLWNVTSIETGREIYAHPYGFEFYGFKYWANDKNGNCKLFKEAELTKENFVTRQTHPEYFL